MALTKLKIQVRIEELPTVGKFIRDAFARDLADFTGYSPQFDAAYLTNLDGKLTVVNGVINPKQLTAELKLITQGIYQNMFDLREVLDKLEGYVKRATGLTVGVKDFGISAVRTKNNNGDQEGLDGALAYLLTNITNNMAALVAKGYSAAQKTVLENIKSGIALGNASQNLKEDARDAMVVQNYGVMNELWEILLDVNDGGKRIYKRSQPAKLDDYTMAALKKRIRQEQKKSKLIGTIKAGGNAVANAKIVVRPASGGRSKSGKSKTDGKYEIKDLAARDYIVTVTADGHAPSTATVTIKSGEAMSLDFEL